MNHIKLYEDYRIIEKSPDKFFLILRNTEETFQSLSQLKFEGLQGISDNPEIIKVFLIFDQLCLLWMVTKF